ncbi:MAG: hypothetical protein S4CHLAM37_13750 [Chlamydiia bacterium]|nr:hypothetical protein [Chlamydiia bacterium]
MNPETLQKKIAKLESLYDQLQSEMNYLDNLLKEVGFEEGLKTLKEAAIELKEKKKNSDNNKF